MKTWLLRISFTLLVLVFVFSGGKTISLTIEEKHNSQLMADAQALYKDSDSQSTVTTAANDGVVIDGSEYREAFSDLKNVNSDIVGWLTIPDTKIDYPILKTDNNSFYLTHNYQKESYAAGSLFMDYRNTSELTDPNTIIYGHSMRNKTMFGQLVNYLDKSFFDAHQTISFDSMVLSYDVKIFAVYETTTDNDYIQTEFNNQEAFQSYLAKAQADSLYQTEVAVNSDSRILTLSTCDKDYAANGRIVVQGLLVPKTIAY